MRESLSRVQAVVTRVFFPATAAVGICALALVFSLFGPLVAVKGSYTLIGVTIGAVFYHFSRFGPETDRRDLSTSETDRRELSIGGWAVPADGRLERWGTKCVTVVVLLSVTYAFTTGNRVPVLVVGLPLGYSILAVQYVYGDRSRSRPLVAQTVGLFAVSPLTKYATTGFYFGSGDLFGRVGEISQLLSSGSIEGITALYKFYAGLHFLSAATHLVAGVPLQDVIVLVGSVTYCAVSVAIYTIARRTTDSEEFALAVLLTVTFLDQFHYFSTYFYSQSLAISLATFFLLVVLRRTQERTPGLDVALVVLLVALVATHHFTFVLLFPVVALVALVAALNPGDVARGRRFVVPFAVLLVAAVFHWSFSGWAWWFFIQLSAGIGIVLTSSFAFAPGSGGGGAPLALGTTPPVETISSVLVYPPYVYLVSLTAVFAVGVVSAIQRAGSVRRVASFLVAGVAGAALVFDTPLSFPGLRRASLAWLVPFSFVTGAGLFYLRRNVSGVGRVALVVLVVVFGTMGAMGAAGDLGKFSGTREASVSISDQEYRQLSYSTEFYGAHGSQISGLWITSEVYERFGVESVGRGTVTADGFVTPRGLFLYRTDWANHRVRFTPAQSDLRSMYVSESYLTRVVRQENKVYDAGGVGMVWNANRSTLGERSGPR